MTDDSRAAAQHDAVHFAAERAARTSYGRLLAILARATGDISLAEDCLGTAFARALETWGRTGVPHNPAGWLLTAARNAARDAHRSAAHRQAVPLDPSSPALPAVLDVIDPDAIPDERLALLFVCAHPAVAPAARTPLMLQTVLGFDAEQIARAFAVRPAAMAQRLVRAKRRIRDAGIPFAVPDRSRMTERLTPVLEAIYGAYAMDWQLTGGTTIHRSMAGEAHFLAGTLAELLPEQPEALGLAALLSLSMARSPARDAGEEYVPLDRQDPALWDASLIAHGERLLRRAHALGRPGRFQLEAAIQSVHCSGEQDWHALRGLYEALVAVAPTLGARVALGAAIARTEGPAAGLAALDALPRESIQRFQPWWATRAHLLSQTGRRREAVAAYEKAISLTTEPPVRRYLAAMADANHPSVPPLAGMTPAPHPSNAEGRPEA